MADHTPGPWRIDLSKSGTYPSGVLTNDGKVIALTYHQGRQVRDGQWEEEIANARLIAAAPDLLAALEHLISQLPSDERLADFHLDFAEAAIAKAKGEADAR